jgi:hypothetical protein
MMIATLAAITAAFAPPAAFATPAEQSDAPALRDGSHDFDPMLGVWKTQIRRTADPFAHPEAVIEMSGIVTTRKVWGGRAQIEEIEVDTPTGHWEGMTLFLYDPQAHQWSQSFADSADGTLQRPTIGGFANGRGELYAQDKVNGRTILIRGLWSDITANAHRYEESLSDDGGKTWHIAFSAALTRIAAAAP